MGDSLPKFVNASEAKPLLDRSGVEFAVVRNPGYVHPPFELYPLPPKKRVLHRGLRAVVMDMDGTTTTTEALCLHSLETMVRRLTGRLSREYWPGLDRERDYPHIIGNSTTRHVEYLVRTYGEAIDESCFRRFIVHQAAWTLAYGQDENRKEEVLSNLAAAGCRDLLDDDRFRRLVLEDSGTEDATDAEYSALGETHLTGCDLDDFSIRVRFAVDVYYQRYHEILRALKLGEGQHLAEELLGGRDRRLIEPMPGVGCLLALVKGWLGREAGSLIDLLSPHLPSPPRNGREVLRELGEYFERNPIRTAVVTSSIRYEAEIVLKEVFGILRTESAAWPVSERIREKAQTFFGSPEAYYDAIITASDSSEIRLKPHRDLYSIALHRLGVPVEDFDRTIGFEDSESGTIAIRAAGIPVCIAVPFAETGGHSFEAASCVCLKGLPEAILHHRLFLPDPLPAA